MLYILFSIVLFFAYSISRGLHKKYTEKIIFLQ